MTLTLITAAVFIFVLMTVGYYGYRMYSRPAELLQKLQAPPAGLRDMATGGFASDTAQLPNFRIRKALLWLGERMPVQPDEATATQRMLISAGYRAENALPIFLALRIVTACGLLAVAAAVTMATNWLPLLDIAILIVAAGLGYWLPQLILEEFVIPRYHEALRYALPDALDMMVVCVEAGIGLDQAIRMVSEELYITHPELCKELRLISVEMRAGERRADALRNLAERTREPELGKLVALLVQTDRFGTSIGDALRTHGEFMRVKRRQEAQEKAGKLGVKLVLPIFFFILPTILILALTPAMIQISATLGNMKK